MHWMVTGPKATESNNHRLKSVRPWPKLNLSSSKSSISGMLLQWCKVDQHSQWPGPPTFGKSVVQWTWFKGKFHKLPIKQVKLQLKQRQMYWTTLTSWLSYFRSLIIATLEVIYLCCIWVVEMYQWTFFHTNNITLMAHNQPQQEYL